MRKLPFDEYRQIDKEGIEDVPRDIYDWSNDGRLRYVRELLELNARNMVRQHLIN